MTDSGGGAHNTEDEQWAAFLDRLVHDLREPLRSIGVFSELLAEMAKGRLGGDGDQMLSEIIAGASRMGTLLEGLSGYSLALRESADPSTSITSLQTAFNIVVAGMDDEIRACNA